MLKNRKNLTFLAGVQVDENVYFSAWNINGLFRMDPKTGECTFLTRFAGEGEHCIHSSAIYYKEAIWFIPSWSDRITRVDIHTLEMSYLMLPDQGVNIVYQDGSKPSIKLKVCYKAGESNLYLTPYAYNLVLQVDLDKKELFVFSECEKNIFSDSLRTENEIWLCPSRTGQGVIFDIVSRNEKRFYFNTKNGSYLNIRKHNKQMVFFPYKLETGIVITDFSSGEEKRLYFPEKDQNYQTLCVTENFAFLPPYQGNKCVLADFGKMECSAVLCLPEKKFALSKGLGYYLTCMKYNNEWWFLSSHAGNPALRYQPAENSITFVDIWTENRLYETDFIKYLSDNREELPLIYKEILFTEAEHSFDFFIDFVKIRGEEEKQKKDINEGQIYKILENSMKN